MANHLTKTSMDIKLPPLDYNIIIGLSEMSLTNNDIAAEPIIKSLLEQFNNKIKNGDIVDIWNFSITPIWYSFKQVNCKRVTFNLNYIIDGDVKIDNKLHSILTAAYPTAAIWVYIKKVENTPNKRNVEVTIGFREDGKLLRRSDI